MFLFTYVSLFSCKNKYSEHTGNYNIYTIGHTTHFIHKKKMFQRKKSLLRKLKLVCVYTCSTFLSE